MQPAYFILIAITAICFIAMYFGLRKPKPPAAKTIGQQLEESSAAYKQKRIELEYDLCKIKYELACINEQIYRTDAQLLGDDTSAVFVVSAAVIEKAKS